jgi:hypothetical protein
MALRARRKDEQDPERRSMLERAISKVETGEPAAPAPVPETTHGRLAAGLE